MGWVIRTDTVGESFELNIAAAQETETLTGTAKPIILAQGPVRGNGILAIPIQLRRAVIPQVVPFQFVSNDSPTVSGLLKGDDIAPYWHCAMSLYRSLPYSAK